jgi:hypothetical protein
MKDIFTICFVYRHDSHGKKAKAEQTQEMRAECKAVAFTYPQWDDSQFFFSLGPTQGLKKFSVQLQNK